MQKWTIGGGKGMNYQEENSDIVPKAIADIK